MCLDGQVQMKCIMFVELFVGGEASLTCNDNDGHSCCHALASRSALLKRPGVVTNFGAESVRVL